MFRSEFYSGVLLSEQSLPKLIQNFIFLGIPSCNLMYYVCQLLDQKAFTKELHRTETLLLSKPSFIFPFPGILFQSFCKLWKLPCPAQPRRRCWID